MPNQSLLYTGRVLACSQLHEMMHIARELCGGQICVTPDKAAFEAPETKPWLEKYYSVNENWVAEDRRKLLAFARDLLNSDYAGHRLTFQLFAQSPPFAHLAAVYRNFDWNGPLDFVRKAADLSEKVHQKVDRPNGDRAVQQWYAGLRRIPAPRRRARRRKVAATDAPAGEFPEGEYPDGEHPARGHCPAAALSQWHESCRLHRQRRHHGRTGRAGHGVTVSAMVSVSADTPQPTLLVCIHYKSPVAGCGSRERRILRQRAARGPESYLGKLRGPHRGARRLEVRLLALDHAGDRGTTRGRCAGSLRLPRYRERTDRIAFRGIRIGAGHFHRGRGRSARSMRTAPTACRSVSSARRRAAAETGGTLALGCFQILAPYMIPAIVARMMSSIRASRCRCSRRISPSCSRACAGEVEIALLVRFRSGQARRRGAARRARPVRAPARGPPPRRTIGGDARGARHRAPGLARSRAEPRLLPVAVPRARPGSAYRPAHALIGNSARAGRARARLQLARDQASQQHVL